MSVKYAYGYIRVYVQKNEALKQIVDKIIYDKESDSLKIYFFLCR